MTYVKDYLDQTVSMIQGHTTRRLGHYVNADDYYRRNGTLMHSKGLDSQSAQLLRGIRKHAVYEQKACWYNAMTILLEWEPQGQDVGVGVQYWEGYATSGVLPVRHAWFTLNGSVVDLTWRPEVVGIIPADHEYYGVQIEDVDVVAYLQNHNWTPGPMVDDWEHGWPMLIGASHEVGVM